MYAEERQQAIARLVAQRSRIGVQDLASRFRVTTETVRRDLSALERLGLVRRVHGGAVPVGALGPNESGLGEREGVNVEAKQRIAKAALALLPPAGSTVLMDAGTTTSRLAAELPADRPLSVWTHSVPVASHLLVHPQLELHLLPGRVRATTQAAVGPSTIAALADLRAEVAFLGTNGLTPDHGLTTPDPDEAATKRGLVAAAHHVVVLADGAKLGHESAVRFAATGEVDTLVTDDSADPDLVTELEATGMEVLIA